MITETEPPGPGDLGKRAAAPAAFGSISKESKLTTVAKKGLEGPYDASLVRGGESL